MPPWAARLLLLAVFALGLALGVNGLFAKLLTVDPARLAAATAAPESSDSTPATSADSEGKDASLTHSAKPVSRAERSKLSYFLDPIMKRNIFDSTATAAGAGSGDAGDGADGDARKSELEVTLIAVAVATKPIWSTALISTGVGMVQLYQIGDPLLTAVVHDIQRPYLSEDGKHHPARVVVMRDGTLEFIDAGGPARKGKKAKKTAKKKNAKKKGGRHKWTGIRKTGDNKYTIEQSEVDYALGNLDKLSREARVVPNFQDGATNGFKVFSIRRNSALRKMGVKNNDVLTGVNNFDLSNTQKALEIYSKLQTEKSFRLDILRNGEPMTLEYDIQ
jgi:general secretion pathway protein C